MLPLATPIIALAAGTVVVEAVELDATDFAYGDYTATGLRTVQLWLAGLDPGDSVRQILGQPLAPISIETTDPDGFYNGIDVGQSHFHSAEALFPVFPELQWDTFVTIGRSLDTDVLGDFPDTALEGGGSSILGAEHIAWYDAEPFSPETEVGGRLLLGQFSFRSAYALNLEEMQLNAIVANADGQTRLLLDLDIVPAPAAWLLLGGLAGLRRRRRSGA